MNESESLQIESGQSFPISADSTEAEQFERALPKIVEYLDEEKVPWQSIGCVGRVSEGSNPKIWSTILISVSILERSSEDTKIPDLRLGVQNAGNIELPVEFVVGSNQLQWPFGFKELTSPLICGASCDNVTKPGWGTLGGFITAKGGSNKETAYAMSNHHVFVGLGDKSIDDLAIPTDLLTSLEKLRNLDEEQAIGEFAQLCNLFYERKKSSMPDPAAEFTHFQTLCLSK
jgi:hypothetical protein